MFFRVVVRQPLLPGPLASYTTGFGDVVVGVRVRGLARAVVVRAVVVVVSGGGVVVVFTAASERRKLASLLSW